MIYRSEEQLLAETATLVCDAFDHKNISKYELNKTHLEALRNVRISVEYGRYTKQCSTCNLKINEAMKGIETR